MSETEKLITIREAINLPAETKATFVGKICSVGTVETYKVDGEERKYITLAVCDATDYTIVRVYQINRVVGLEAGKCYLFSQVIRKTGIASFWAVSKSRISCWADIETPDNIIKAAGEASLKEEPNKLKTLEEALNSTSTSRIKGKVVQTSPLKYTRDGTLPTKFLAIKDSTKTVKIALFGEDAQNDYNPNDVMAITDVYRWKASETLSTKQTSKVEFLPSTSLADIKVTEADQLKDDDFQKNEEKDAETEEFKIMGLSSCTFWESCTKPGCKNRKIVNGKCQTCGATSLTKNRSIVTQI